MREFFGFMKRDGDVSSASAGGGPGAAAPSRAVGWGEDFLRALPQAKLDEPMGRHTTFRIGGPADAYVELQGVEDLSRLLRFARERRLPVFWIGRGSNLLVLDRGIRGIVARLRGEFEAIEFPGAGRVRAGAGVRLPAMVAACARRGLAGAEPLAGVPGTVGGALVMNAGTKECEIGSLTASVRVFDARAGLDRWLGADTLDFHYRGSSLEGSVVLGGEFQLKAGGKVDILRRVRRLQRKRLQTQPVHTYNVGSTFKNPPGRFVAELIEKTGFKGARCGGAKVSEKHANFFENERHASARDVLALVERVRAAVRERFGVELELEMKVVGEA